MDLSTLSNGPGQRKKRKRVGRGPGSGTGKTAGKGHKGQKARSGYSRRQGFEGGQMPLHRRLPKRGFFHGKRQELVEINVDVLEKVYASGDVVNLESLRNKGLGRFTGAGVKLLGRGDLTKQLNVQVHAVSEAARSKIEAAGGSIELVVWRQAGDEVAAAPAEE